LWSCQSPSRVTGWGGGGTGSAIMATSQSCFGGVLMGVKTSRLSGVTVSCDSWPVVGSNAMIAVFSTLTVTGGLLSFISPPFFGDFA